MESMNKSDCNDPVLPLVEVQLGKPPIICKEEYTGETHQTYFMESTVEVEEYNTTNNITILPIKTEIFEQSTEEFNISFVATNKLELQESALQHMECKTDTNQIQCQNCEVRSEREQNFQVPLCDSCNDLQTRSNDAFVKIEDVVHDELKSSWKEKEPSDTIIPTQLNSTNIVKINRKVKNNTSKGRASSSNKRKLERKTSFTCSVCYKIFSQSSHLNIHKRLHTGEKPFNCNVCYKSFSQSSNLTKHKRLHTGEKPLACNICNKSFDYSYQLTSHLRFHSGEKPFTCNICNKSFSQPSNLTKHKLLHTGVKTFTCSICCKGFSQASHLKKHKRLHTGEKPFACNICNKSFTDSSCLTPHMRIHTGERPYTCDICNKRFSYSSVLTKHKRLHTGEKPFNCNICNKSFSQASHLTSHKRKHKV